MTCQGKALEYLGMKIDYRQQGKVKFIMYEYIKKLLEKCKAWRQPPHRAIYSILTQDVRN